MTVKRIQPSRQDPIVNKDGIQTLRFSKFLANLADKMDNISSITTADATDLSTVIALANVNKAKINEILSEMQSAKVMNG